MILSKKILLILLINISAYTIAYSQTDSLDYSDDEHHVNYLVERLTQEINLTADQALQLQKLLEKRANWIKNEFENKRMNKGKLNKINNDIRKLITSNIIDFTHDQIKKFNQITKENRAKMKWLSENDYVITSDDYFLNF